MRGTDLRVPVLRQIGYVGEYQRKRGNEQVLEAVKWLKPDVVILDVGMPRMNGMIAARHLADKHPDPKILIYTYADDAITVNQALLHAHGIVLKTEPVCLMLDAVDAIRAGKTWFPKGRTKSVREVHRPVCA